MELRGRGWSISAAAREVGVSRTAANNWAFGYKVDRKGQVVGVVTPVDRLAVREISPRYLSQDERIRTRSAGRPRTPILTRTTPCLVTTRK